MTIAQVSYEHNHSQLRNKICRLVVYVIFSIIIQPRTNMFNSKAGVCVDVFICCLCAVFCVSVLLFMFCVLLSLSLSLWLGLCFKFVFVYCVL